ncbi:CocE/NonD family hydrolase [Cellulomonas sp. APG4]|uniref:CocE/NonD family hydrolase n=1 Tax=Cellulomonas sp. APG4 TaxID=1538656 RepID=UPI00137A8BE3|nr:CocE/NonD family hydrolase [Cellulomonas sp. APG4]NCT92484.1 CocE/NonD family hydrolase [Cellulomonas sp. APG4]
MTAPAQPASTALRSLTEHDVPVPLRDGTVLRAVVTRPADGAPAPVLLMRSPYPLEGTRFDVDPWGVLRRGLALVRVSHRGTGASAGGFEPWRDDAADGADVISWCAAQPWSSGDVVTYGRSYLAQTQLFAAGERPPALRAMGLGVCPGDPYDVVHQDGALLLGSGLGWALAQAGGGLARAAARGEADDAGLARWRRAMADFDTIVAGDGPADLPTAVLDVGLPSWRAWVDHPARDDWWAARALPVRDPLPSFYVGGWHDIFVRGTLAQFERSRHPASRLVVGPWGHGPGLASLGEVHHGLEADALGLGLEAEMLDALAGWVRDEPTDPPADPPVRLFLMGAGRWIGTRAWPPPESRDRTYFLHGDGTLAVEPPAVGAPPVTYVHDPSDPVPTLGGPNLFLRGEAAYGTGSWDQRAKDARPDVVRFETAPLEADLDVVGVVRLSLVASTSARDADWCATLVDVHPDGRALNVVDGVVRARFATSDTHETLLEPDVAHRLEIEVGPTAQRFAAGHRLRVDVASSNHPRFDVNPGTGGTWAHTPRAEHVVAHQRVHVDHDAASYLTLPVLDVEETR